MPEPADTAADPEFPLVAQLVQQSYDNYASTSQTLIGNLMEENRTLRAELACIRGNVTAAYKGPYAPNPAWVIGHLYPDKADVAPYLEEPSS